MTTDRKRVRRGESFGRLGVDRTISNSLKSPSRRKQRSGITTAPTTSATGDAGTPSITCSGTSACTTTTTTTSRKTVRFEEETPSWNIHLCSHFDKDMTDEERDERKRELWYTRCDFEDFLRERIATIRLLQTVQGDGIALRERCPDVCLRGLEPYQCSVTNHELQSQRQWHQRVVLAEQSLQRKKKQQQQQQETTAEKRSPQQEPRGDVPLPPGDGDDDDDERIRQLAEEISEWARHRARQLAGLDELEVRLADAEPQTRRRSLACAQLGMENLMIQHRQRRRASMALAAVQQSTATANLLGLSSSSQQRVPVDLAILKEWNAKFLDDIRRKGGAVPGGITTHGDGGPGFTTTNTAPLMMGTSLSEKTAQSRLALQRQRNSLLGPTTTTTITSYGSASSSSSGTQYGSVGSSGSSCLMSGSSLVNAELLYPKDEALTSAAPGFRFPVRRDSLVGLRRDNLAVIRVAALGGGGGDAAAAAAASGTSSSGGVALTDACFRFPVRRDSLSNVHWTS